MGKDPSWENSIAAAVTTAYYSLGWGGGATLILVTLELCPPAAPAKWLVPSGTGDEPSCRYPLRPLLPWGLPAQMVLCAGHLPPVPPASQALGWRGDPRWPARGRAPSPGGGASQSRRLRVAFPRWRTLLSPAGQNGRIPWEGDELPLDRESLEDLWKVFLAMEVP